MIHKTAVRKTTQTRRGVWRADNDYRRETEPSDSGVPD